MHNIIVNFSLKPCKKYLLFMAVRRAPNPDAMGNSHQSCSNADNYFFHNLREELFFVSHSEKPFLSLLG